MGELILLRLTDYIKVDEWPLGSSLVPDRLDNVFITPLKTVKETLPSGKTADKYSIGVMTWDDLYFSIPGIPNIKFFAGSNATAGIATLEVRTEPYSIGVSMDLGIFLDSSLLKKLKNGTDEPDPANSGIILQLGTIRASVDIDGNFDIDAAAADISLPRCMIGDSGVIIEKASFRWLTPSTASAVADAPNGFKGVYLENVEVSIPKAGVGKIGMSKVFIGNTGFNGTVYYNENISWNKSTKSFSGGMSGSLFDIPFCISGVKMEFKNNVPSGAAIAGAVNLPYFEHPLMVEVGFDTAFNISARVAAVQTINGLTTPSTEDGMLVLEKEGLLKLSVNSIGFEKKKDDYAIAISGKIKPLVLEGCIPGVELKKLAIHSDGRVDVDGGWLDLSNQLTFEMSGFKAEITQIGFGSESDGKKWFGISGSITVIQSVPFKGSVEGFKLIWDSNTGKVDFSLKGIGLEFEIEDVLSFKGKVSLMNGDDGRSGIMGALKVILYCLKGCGIDMQFMAGKNRQSPAYNFFYLAANLTLPVGIPLAQTGIAIYGFAGLFGYNVVPNKGQLPGKENESWYKNDDGSNGWYLRDPIGVTDFTKWIDQRDSFSLGAGLTIGTLSDGGYTFSGGVLLVLSIPGPIIMLEGKANFMRELSKLNEDPIFRVFAIFDGKAGTLLFNLQAKYIYPYPSGTVIKVSGLTELFLDFNNPDRWHLYLGREKEEQRLIADIFSLFTASSYMMVDSSSFRMGVSVSIKKSWKYNPARVELGAYFDGRLLIAYKPFQAEGRLVLGGYVKVSIWGFSISLEASAGVAAKTPNPFQINAYIKVKVDAPWPIPDFEKQLELEWKKEAEPPIPIATVSIGIEHGKGSDKWQLTRYPVYDTDKDGMINEFKPDANVPVPTDCPVVPLDSKPVITFAKHVNANGIGDNASLAQACESCGSHKFEYSLLNITLERQEEDGEWTAVPSDVMFSKWQDVIKDGRKVNTKLMLWARTSKEIYRDNPVYNGKDRELLENTESELLTEITQHRVDFEDCTASAGLIVDTELVDITIFGNAKIIDCPLEPNYEITKGVQLYSSETSDTTNTQYATNFTDHIGESFEQKFTDGLLTYSTNDTDLQTVEKIDGRGGIIFQELSVSMPRSEYIYAMIYNMFQVEMIVYDIKGLVIDRMIRGETSEQVLPAKYHISVIELKLSKRAATVAFIAHEVPAYLMEFRCIAYKTITAMPSIIRYIFSEPVGRVVLNTYGQGSLKLVSQDVNNQNHLLSITCKDNCPEPFRLELEYTDIRVLYVRGDGIISFIDFSTMEEIRTKEKQIWLNDELVKSISEKWDQHSAYIFEPNSVYRLGVSTQVKKDKISNDLLEYAFFKTGMAPGISVQSQILCEEDKNRYPVGGMLTNLGLYVSSTVPCDGGTAAYFAYDTGVAYNETYVDTMYITSGRRLEMKLYDNNNKPVVDADGNEIEYDNNWGDNPQLTLTTTEIEYLDVITDGKAERVDITNLKKTVCLNTKGAVLNPKTFYTAKLIAKDSAGSNDVVYSFNFTTSAYASFIHHINSFNNSIMKLSHNYDLCFGSGMITGITSRLAKYPSNNKWNNTYEPQDFEIIFNSLGMIPRALPKKVEVSLIDLPEGNKGFYIESPEPIDADRTEYRIKCSQIVNPFANKLFECADSNAKMIGISQTSSVGAGSLDIIFREAVSLKGMKLYIEDYATGEQNPYINFISKSESLSADLGAVVRVPDERIYPGTVVRLNFGSIADTVEPGIENLKVLNADTIPATGSRLTLMDAEGKKLHSHHVLDRSILSTKDYIMVRNNDCTRMFVFLPDGVNKASNVNPGIYRMELTYNRNIGLDKPILKRNGSEKAETTYIDFQI